MKKNIVILKVTRIAVSNRTYNIIRLNNVPLYIYRKTVETVRENFLNYIIWGGVEGCFCSVSYVSFGEFVINSVNK